MAGHRCSTTKSHAYNAGGRYKKQRCAGRNSPVQTAQGGRAGEQVQAGMETSAMVAGGQVVAQVAGTGMAGSRQRRKAGWWQAGGSAGRQQ